MAISFFDSNQFGVLPNPGHRCGMEYRGKQYKIAQGTRPASWRWEVELHEKGVKSGEAPTHEAARVRVMWIIDDALAHKTKPKRPPTAG